FRRVLFRSLFVQAEEAQVHGWMLPDGAAGPQCPAAEARARLVERRIEPSRAAGLLEQPELRGGRELSEDHAQQAKFHPRVSTQPAGEELRGDAGDGARLEGRRGPGALAGK